MDSGSASLRACQKATDATFDALFKLCTDEREKLRVRWKAAHARMEKLEAKKAALAKENGGSSVKGSDRLRLNIGGQVVEATRDTLTSVPGSRLEALFSGRWESKLLRDHKKRAFLDLDPYCFRKIIDYINILKISGPDDLPEAPVIDDESKAIFEATIDFLDLRKIFTPAFDSTIDSTIIKEASHLRQLCTWLGETAPGKGKTASLTPLYRASKDGWGANIFHARCDNRGSTLTIVHCNGNIFGGFSESSWNSSNAYVPSPHAFLFTLKCHSGMAPSKMEPKGTNQEIYCNSGYGPSFGGGHDLHICTNANGTTGSYSNVGHAFNCPSGQNGPSFLTGGRNFTPSEVEVFLVTFGANHPQAPSLPSTAQRSKKKGNAKVLGKLDNSKLPEPLSTMLAAERLAVSDFEEDVIELEQSFSQEQALVKTLTSGTQKDIVKLSLSGKILTVKRETLRICPDSVLARKFDDKTWTQETGRRANNNDDYDSDDDAVLIEQSPYCFKKIVSQLRIRAMLPQDTPIPPPVVRESEVRNLERVVKFYFPGCEDFVMCPSPFFRDSEILKADASYSQLLQDWLPAQFRGKSTLLYRASIHGWASSQFHALCDNKGATVAIIRSNNGYIFGGFADASWNSFSAYSASPQAFLFTMKCHTGLAPTKMLQKATNHHIYCSSDRLCTFGGNHDIYVANNPNSNASSSTNIGHSYTCPPGQTANTFLTGAQAFTASEIEVFLVSA